MFSSICFRVIKKHFPIGFLYFPFAGIWDVSPPWRLGPWRHQCRGLWGVDSCQVARHLRRISFRFLSNVPKDVKSFRILGFFVISPINPRWLDAPLLDWLLDGCTYLVYTLAGSWALPLFPMFALTHLTAFVEVYDQCARVARLVLKENGLAERVKVCLREASLQGKG